MRLLTLSLLAVLLMRPLPAAPQTALFPNDHALDRTVEVSANGEPLDALLARLSNDAVKLQSGGDTPWERVTLYAHGRTLRQVMADLATLLHYAWSVEGSPARYTLAPTGGIRRYEREMLRQMLERGAVHLLHLPELLKTPEDDWRRLMKDRESDHPMLDQPADPVARENLFYLQRTGPRVALEMLTALSPDQLLTLLSDEQLILSEGGLTDRQRTLLQQMGLDVG